jgi:RNA polymerase sigma factor (sigma-70 family)
MLSLTSFMTLTSGDSRPNAWEQQTAALRPAVARVVVAILGGSLQDPDVEDCTHEVLRRALEGKAALRSEEALRPWVLGIARHVALDAIRDRQRGRRRTAEGADLDRVVDSRLVPEEQAVRLEQQYKLRDAMERLPKGQREALMLFHAEGLGYGEIARRLGVPLGTVATWITRGRQAMASVLGEES